MVKKHAQGNDAALPNTSLGMLAQALTETVSVSLLCVIEQSPSNVWARFQQRSQQPVKHTEPKEKPHSLLQNCGVYLVAWTGIEPVTRGFST